MFNVNRWEKKSTGSYFSTWFINETCWFFLNNSFMALWNYNPEFWLFWIWTSLMLFSPTWWVMKWDVLHQYEMKEIMAQIKWTTTDSTKNQSLSKGDAVLREGFEDSFLLQALSREPQNYKYCSCNNTFFKCCFHFDICRCYIKLLDIKISWMNCSSKYLKNNTKKE